jgi:CBS domain containing-hemolysin-like protein
MTVVVELVAVVLLILLNAFFVAGEYALVTVRRTRMKELADEGSRTARSVVKITSDPPHFIAAMQLGVTLTSLAIGALGERVLSEFFDQWLATVLAVLLAFLIITFLHVVVGELVPKGIALSYSERVALAVSAPVRLFFFVFKPLIWVLQRSSEGAQRAIGIDPSFSEGVAHSEAELKMLLEVSTEHGEIEKDEREMLYKVFDFAEKEVADVMVPRPDVAGLAIDLAPEEAMAAMLEAPYTRYPVYRETLDDIVGILHVRDLVASFHNGGGGAVALADLLRAPYVVPETKDLGALLADFRRTSQHIAVVVDEYGATAGIVTLEDLLEEIVGDIEDEFDLPNELVERLSETTVRIDGSFTIDDFNEEFGTGLETEDFHTVAGFVFGHLGRAAEVGDEVAEDQVRFRVLETSGSRIQRLEVEFLPPSLGADDTPEAA